jgi:hypothetical protein
MSVNPDERPKPSLQLAYEAAGPGGPRRRTAIGLVQEPDDFPAPSEAPGWFTLGYRFFAKIMKKRICKMSSQMCLHVMKSSYIPRFHRQVLAWRWRLVIDENPTQADGSKHVLECGLIANEFSKNLDRAEIEAAWCLWQTGNWRNGTVYR